MFTHSIDDSDIQSELTTHIRATDEVEARERPQNIKNFYAEQEYDEAELEQIAVYEEKAAAEARGAETEVAALTHQADGAVVESEAAAEQARTARELYTSAAGALSKYVRRPVGAKRLYYIRLFFLLLGDIAGVSGAALLLGEEVFNAVAQAASAAVAAVTLGAVGREVRYVFAARARARDLATLTDEEKEYQDLFAGPHTGERLLKVVIGVCATGTLLVAGGIFALRSSTVGSEAGLVFGCLALAFGLGSFYNAFDVADDVAELLDNLSARLKKAEKQAGRARSATVISRRDRAAAEAQSIREEQEKAGLAAATAIRRLKYKMLAESPVAGNGYGYPQASTSLGTDDQLLLDLFGQRRSNGNSNGRPHVGTR